MVKLTRYHTYDGERTFFQLIIFHHHPFMILSIHTLYIYYVFQLTARSAAWFIARTLLSNSAPLARRIIEELTTRDAARRAANLFSFYFIYSPIMIYTIYYFMFIYL